MSVDTLRSNKMRSALTVLGVVIGITSIVGMTSLIRGFDESLRDLFRELGPNTIFVQKFGLISASSGKTFLEIARRPNLSMDDAKAIARECPSVAIIDVWLGGGPGSTRPRMFYGNREDQATRDSRRDRELRRRQFRQARVGTLLPADRGRAPQAGRRSRPDAVRVAFPQHRSARQESPDRHERVHRHRRARQTAEPRWLQRRRRRLRRHPLHRRTRSSTARCSRDRRGSRPATSRRRCSARR